MSKEETDELIRRLQSCPRPRDRADRQRLWEALRSFSATIEDEFTLQHRLLSSPLLLVVPRIANDIGIFDALLKNDGSALSTDELAVTTNTDNVLLGRILRYLASQLMISSPSPNYWAPSTVTPFLANPAYAAGLRYGTTCLLPSCLAFPDLLRSHSYADTTSISKTAFQLAHSTDMSMFEWLTTQPTMARMYFQQWMAEMHKRDDSPFDVLPLERFLPQHQNTPPSPPNNDGNDDHATALFVDIGGGNGKSCIDFRSRYPHLKGRVINQDIEATALGLQAPVSTSQDTITITIEHQNHDFLTAQPIKHAKIYHVRKVLRICSDDQCVTLLRHLRDAIADYSVILVDDVAIDDTAAANPDWHVCYVDLMMGMLFGARERTVLEFMRIFERAGLVVRDVGPYMAGSDEHYFLLGREEE